MYVCIYVCMYVCMYIYVYVYMYVCMYVYVCMYMYVYVCHTSSSLSSFIIIIYHSSSSNSRNFSQMLRSLSNLIKSRGVDQKTPRNDSRWIQDDSRTPTSFFKKSSKMIIFRTRFKKFQMFWSISSKTEFTGGFLIS